ncbi:MAG: sugar phosphate isomerase/epimerase [Firmicutes bacterium]|nr:sugar phosphate isomerase/epimerase [Candidatus Colivicinus equi]
MNKLAAVITNDNCNVTIYETMDAIKKAGFNNAFIQWYDKDFEVSQEKQLEYARKIGLNIIFAHLGYQGINNLWLDNVEGEELTNRFINDIRVCKDNDIDFVVLHLTSKSVAPEYGEVGLNRLRRICDFARKIGVRVAFENTKIKGYMDYVLSNIIDDNVGFCYDIGHCHAHFNDEFDFDLVKNRMFAIHAHDNEGDRDAHYLPYDGNIDWDQVIANLKYVNYDGYITLEVVYSEKYLDMSIDEYYAKAYDIASKLSLKLEK